MSNISNSGRIAKNTIFLYIRTIVTLGISLFTSRVILQALGFEDFGIYNIVGGVVILFSFLNGAMTQSTQRFLNYEMGYPNHGGVGAVFSTSINAHISIAFLLLILAETVGLWFLNTQLNIPAERMDAANVVYQFTILTLCIQIFTVPFTALIIAHENMGFYAVINILESVLKLAIAYCVLASHRDRLVLYSLLIVFISLAVLILYFIRCRFYKHGKYAFSWNGTLYRELMSFSGWSLFGSASSMAANQGVNILLNIFWGVTVNSAAAIANQVNSAVNSFLFNFQTAFKPQMVKSIASGETEYAKRLIFQTSRISFFLLYVISFPILLNTDYILRLWLTDVPNYTNIFCQLTIVYTLLETLSGPLWITVQAVGKIKIYQIVISSIFAGTIVFSWIALSLGFPPPAVFGVKIAVGLAILYARIHYAHKYIGLGIMKFISSVIGKITFVVLLSLLFILCLKRIHSDGVSLMATMLFSLTILPLFAFRFGLTPAERGWVAGVLKKSYVSFKNRFK